MTTTVPSSLREHDSYSPLIVHNSQLTGPLSRVLSSPSLSDAVYDPVQTLQEMIDEHRPAFDQLSQHLYDHYRTKHGESYDQLKASRRLDESGQYEGLSVSFPPLDTIMDNMNNIVPSLRVQGAQDLVEQALGDQEWCRALYDDPEQLKARGELILSLHEDFEQLGIDAFELGGEEYLTTRLDAVRQVQDLFGCSIAEARMIYQISADYGFLGTTEEIERVKDILGTLEDRLSFDFTNAVLTTLISSMIGLILSAFTTSITENPFILNLVGVLAFLLLQYSNFMKEGARDFTLSPVRYGQKRYYLHQLSKLESRQELLNVVDSLVNQLAGVDFDQEDYDSMETKQIQSLVTRLGNIQNLMKCTFRGGKKLTFDELNMLDDEMIDELVAQIKPLAREHQEQLIQQTRDTLLAANYGDAAIDEIVDNLIQQSEQNAYLPDPFELIEVDVLSVYATIQELDRLVATLDLSEEQQEGYESLKDIVKTGQHVRDDTNNIHGLRNHVENLVREHSSLSVSLDPIEARQQMRTLWAEQGLSDEQIAHNMSVLRLAEPDDADQVSSGGVEISLDLDELRKHIDQREKLLLKQKELLKNKR